MVEEIIQYIHSHWVAGVFDLIALALSKGHLRLSKQMQADRARTNAINAGVLALLHDRLYQACTFYLKRGFCSIDDRDNLSTSETNYPYRIDNYVKYIRRQKFYGRYMDDWYIMNPNKEELKDLLTNICKIAEGYGIHINMKKTRIIKISNTFKFLQIKYRLADDGKVVKHLNPDRVTAMRRKLKKLAVKVKNDECDYENVENMFRGWMGARYKLLSKTKRENLIQLYEALFNKEITIVNKKLIVSDRSTTMCA